MPPTAADTMQIDDPILPDDAEVVDESYDSENDSSYSASVTSSILAYRTENGRTYHAYKEGRYVVPNDEIENDRLDFQHAIFLRSLKGKLHLAPLPGDVQNVLDVGTGTGIWAIDVADEYPSAKVIGTDLSAIQPSFVPPNLSFLIDDAEEAWHFREPFDLIHGRMVAGSFRDYPRFFKQCYDNLKPGGYVEIHDIDVPISCDDDTLTKSSALYRWSELFVESVGNLGMDLSVTKDYRRLMEEAGFVDIVDVVHRWPQNQWPKDPELKEMGLWHMTNMLEGLQGLSMAAFTRGLGWSTEKLESFLVDVRKDMKDKTKHSYWAIHFIYGRKPEES